LEFNVLPFAVGSLALAVVAYLLGRISVSRADRQRRQKVCAQLYEMALAQRTGSQPIEAALTAAEAAGHISRHECYSVVAQTLDDVNRPATASDYWSRARAAAREQATGEQAYYYYREARSFLRAHNSEFAYIRSKAAIELIELGHIRSSVEGLDYTQHLRAIRMISSLQHLNGNEAWNAALRDAVWLQRNASETVLAELGASISAAHLAGEITIDMIDSL
jgi:hypothetical protein